MNGYQAHVLAEVEAFLRQHRLSDSTFGRRVVNDWSFVKRLRAGKPMTTTTLDKVEQYLRAPSVFLNQKDTP